MPKEPRCRHLANLSIVLFHEAFRECMREGREYWSLRRKRAQRFHLRREEVKDYGTNGRLI